jgi:hypothetical protein
MYVARSVDTGMAAQQGGGERIEDYSEDPTENVRHGASAHRRNDIQV